MKKLLKTLLLLLSFGLLSSLSYAQKQGITGSVTAENGEPLIGVSILIKGSNVGTITDVGGRYNLTTEFGNTLVVSYLGYKSVEKTVNNTTMNFILKEDSNILDEVVVVGYGTQKKSDLTGSLSSVKGEDISKTGAANITQALQGKAAGVYITSNSGAPGAGATIRVRGYGSVSLDLTPLYIVDGQPLGEGQVNQISPNDIESIEVLKDASACAIYGARGANGVVLINTKKGKEGTATINLDISYGTTNAINRIKMMNSDQLYGFLSEAYENDGLRMPRNIARIYTLDGVGLGPVDEYGQPTDINVYDTDWWDEATQKGNRQSYNLSVSGGSEKLKSFFSLGYYTEDGIIKNTDYSRINLRINNEYLFNQYITIGQTLGVAYTKTHDLNIPINEILLPDPFTPIIAKDADKQDPNYEYNKYMGSQYSYYSNPVAIMNRQSKEHISRNIDGTVYANINLGLKGLSFKTLVGFDVPNYNYYEFNPSFDHRPNDTPYNMSTNIESKFLLKNSVVNTSSWSLNYSLQNTLNYVNEFGKHQVSAMLGYTWESMEYRDYSATKYNVPGNSDPFRILDAATVDDYAKGYRSAFSLISYLGRINYNYADKYLATVNIRRDGSSNFARGNRWGTFPSFSLGWRIEQEDFFRNWNQEAISALKLRAGWGQNGNQNLAAFSYANVVSTHDVWIYGFNGALNTLQGYALTQTGNPDITWETSEQTNVGVDMYFFNNSLSFSADYYIKKTKDMILQNPLPSMGGYQNTPYANVGDIQNNGVELLLGYNGKYRDFTYAASLNLTFQRNKLVSTGDGKPLWGTVSKNEVGQPFGRFFGYVYDGIFQTPEEVLEHVGADGTTVLQPNAKPGDIRFKNENNDNALNDDDRTYIGDPNPGVIYGGSLSLGYKGFDLNVYFQGVGGNDLWVQTRELLKRTSMTNLMAEAYTDAWRNPGDKTDVPGISRYDDNDNMRRSSWYVQSGAFCKIKTLQLGYSFPKKWMQATKVFQGVRLYLSGENLLTITKFKYMDPEVPNASALNLGIEQYGYPNPRSFTVGINVQF